MAFMHSLIESSENTVAAIRARICLSAHAEAIGANVNETATRIACMERKRCRAKDPFGV